MKRPRVPPAESELWPEQWRGKRWKPVYAILFAGRGQLCAYACQQPKSQQLMDKWLRQAPKLLCTNHPDSPGELRQVLPTETCRNFCAKRWRRPSSHPARPADGPPSPAAGSKADGKVRRIPLGRGLFATVGAADYKRLKRYKWYATRRGRSIYAACLIEGRAVYMHRLIMQAPGGCPVDHIGGNGLNNRRCNLRVCTQGQNSANGRPRGGSSRFVGVTRRGERWDAHIGWRGQYFYLGLFDHEVEAAKVRDRKAYELNGEFAYINLPEELARWLRRGRGTASARPSTTRSASRRDAKAQRAVPGDIKRDSRAKRARRRRN